MAWTGQSDQDDQKIVALRRDDGANCVVGTGGRLDGSIRRSDKLSKAPSADGINPRRGQNFRTGCFDLLPQLCSHRKASHSWRMLLLVSGTADHGMICITLAVLWHPGAEPAVLQLAAKKSPVNRFGLVSAKSLRYLKKMGRDRNATCVVSNPPAPASQSGLHRVTY
jgi:hypothetical protein